MSAPETLAERLADELNGAWPHMFADQFKIDVSQFIAAVVADWLTEDAQFDAVEDVLYDDGHDGLGCRTTQPLALTCEGTLRILADRARGGERDD